MKDKTGYNKDMTFRQYIQLLAEKIGMHQIPVIANANDIKHFLAEDAVHHQFVTTLVRQIYKGNHCGHLDAMIDQGTTMSLLGRQRAGLLTEDDADICKVRLMNHLCDVSTTLLDKERHTVSRRSPSNGELKDIAEV